ncbi:MAG: pyridoxine 5'-phosphate synthase [Alphaproteobacteria bacterium]|nr:pyridoxine 5'-phosphate synthase [Alphaproteobacteria bacterium]
MAKKLRLGVNVDHVATLRNARGGEHPCPVMAAKLAIKAGADGITAHLREDRRHIKDADIQRLRNELSAPLNFEMAATGEMLALARDIRPHAVCIVPERRAELTTEGGLDVWRAEAEIRNATAELTRSKIRVSLFVPPDPKQIDAAKRTGAPVIELHTGHYAHEREGELKKIIDAAAYASSLGLEVHAGHGLTFDNVKAIAAIPEIVELNIGHFLIGEAVFMGLDAAVKKMRKLMNEVRP